MWARDVRFLPPYVYIYGKNIYLSADERPPTPEGGDNQPTDLSVSGVNFDGDHDFEGLRSPKAHLDTVLRNLLSHPRPPFTAQAV